MVDYNKWDNEKIEWDIRTILEEQNREGAIDIIIEQGSDGLILAKDNVIIEWDFWVSSYKELEKEILKIIK